MTAGLERKPQRSRAAETAPAASSPPPPLLVIEPARRFPGIDLRELWSYRGLFFFLVWRDIKVRYAQTVLGAGWAILQPLLMTVVFSVVFGMLAQIPSDGVPYALFTLTALVPWTYFNTSLTQSSSSLVQNTSLVTKVYFPRLVIPLAPVLAGLLDFAIGFVMLVLVALAFGYVPSLWLLAMLPVLLIVMLLTSAGFGSLLAALNIQYRDIKYVVPFLVQVWMYISPVVFPASLVPDRFRLLYALNPVVSVVEGLRAVMLGTATLTAPMFAVSFASASLLFGVGVLYFRRTERLFADVA